MASALCPRFRKCAADSHLPQTLSINNPTTTTDPISLYVFCSVFVTVLFASHDAGLPTTPQLRPLQGLEARLCDRLFAVCRDHQEPSHQRRHKGPIPGLHWKAGNVRTQFFKSNSPYTDQNIASMPSKQSNTVCAELPLRPCTSDKGHLRDSIH